MENRASDLLEKPPTIAGFEILEQIGSGGMGDVFLARQLSLERTVVIKVLRSIPGKTRSMASQGESRLMAALAHPHVVAIHDCGQAEGQDYLIMEHVKGASLRDHMIPGKPWPPARALPIIAGVGEALAYIQSQGILHLDLKPENVLLDEKGRAKVTDFGISVPDWQGRTKHSSDMDYGTVDYSPPEQRHGLPVDARSDLFSFAALSYELLSGQIPARVYRPISRFQTGLNAKLDQVLRRGLERNPEDRPNSVEEFCRDLTQALLPPKPKVRWPVVAAILVFIGLVPLGILVGLLGFGKQEAALQSNTPSAWNGQSWLLYDQPEELVRINPFEEKLSPFVGQTVSIQGLKPNPNLGMPIPTWPTHSPVLLLSSSEETGFIHLQEDPASALGLLRAWSYLQGLPALAAEDNFVSGELPKEKKMVEEAGVWRAIAWPEWSKDHSAYFGCPDDLPGQPGLQFIRQANAPAGLDLMVYQWIARLPNRENTLMVLRYRARSDEGNGRLSIGLHLPLHIPKKDQGETAVKLRKSSTPHAFIQGTAEEDVFEYYHGDWVQPGASWHTYYSAFFWPAFCKSSEQRNLVISFAGEGKAWVNQIELFPWKVGVNP
ncbi:MAG TPA: serine/threonine-protein kinase [Gemmataceae bacterium]|nr:serine/threonine-protein kinase [Gemmataceae bacterium]